MNRYSISSTDIHGQNLNNSSIKAVYVPFDGFPSIMSDDVDSIISYSFGSDKDLFNIKLNDYYYITLSSEHLMDYLYVNMFATSLYRIHTHDYKNSLYGPAVLFGPLNDLGKHTSISYEALEQVTRLIPSVY